MLNPLEIECPNWHCKAPIGQWCRISWPKPIKLGSVEGKAEYIKEGYIHTRRKNKAKKISPHKQLNLF